MKKLNMILVRPQMGENIGAAARVMANFGLAQMCLVAPRDGWPNVKASDMAGKALYILDDATLHSDVAAAVAPCQFVLATTSRERAMNLPVLTPREAMAEVVARTRQGQQVGVLFGPERTGLENEELALANAVVTIPVSESYPSLNLAQAVAVLAYEFSCQQDTLSLRAQRSNPALEGMDCRVAIAPRNDEMPAPKSELEGLFGQLEAALDAVDFWRVPEKKEAMWRNIRAGLNRAELSSQEVATWRGIIRALLK
jgi:tRNA/rRNA methyltransferase